VFTKASHLSLSSAWMHPVHTPPNLSLRSIPVLYSHLRLGFPSGLFMCSDQNIACVSLLPHARYMPAHRILLDLITLITCDEACKLWNSSLCGLLQPPTTSSILLPNILLSTLFSKHPQSIIFKFQECFNKRYLSFIYLTPRQIWRHCSYVTN